MEIVAQLLIQLPLWGRSFLLFSLFFIIFRPILIWLVPKILWLILFLVQKLLELVFYFLILGLGWIHRSNNQSQYYTNIHRIENGMIGGINGFKTIRIKILDKQRQKKRKAYWAIAVSLSLIISYSVYQWPDKKVGQAWSSIDRWIVEEQLDASMITQKAAWIGSWMGSSETSLAEDKKVTYQLKDSYDGGNLREYPVSSDSLQENNVVMEINQSTVLTFLKESDNRGETEWIKVKTENGTVGWISKGIVKKVN